MIDLGEALRQTGHAADCVNLLAPVTTPYAGGLSSDDPDPRAPQIASIEALAQHCADDHAHARAEFVVPACPGPTCAVLVDDPRDHSPPEPGESSGACLAITMDGRAALASAGPLRDESFCCTIEQVTVLASDPRYVRVTGEMGSECGGGSASTSVDAIYLLDGNVLTLVVDDSVRWR